jgi:hypothetical protein
LKTNSFLCAIWRGVQNEGHIGFFGPAGGSIPSKAIRPSLQAGPWGDNSMSAGFDREAANLPQ